MPLRLASVVTSLVVGLLSVGLGGETQPCRVSVAGAFIEVNAREESGQVVGDVLPLLRALGAEVTEAQTAPSLTGTTFDGKAIQAQIGAAAITIGGREHSLSVPLRLESGRIVGPLAEVAAAIGCRVWRPKAGQELRIAPRLAQVEAYAADEGVLVHIITTGPSPAKLAMLDDPPRAYVDFPSLTWAGGSETIQTGCAGGLQRVRWALFQEWPPVARVVLDLVPGAQARMLSAAPGMFVVAVRPAQRPSSPTSQPRVTSATASLAGVHIVLDPTRTEHSTFQGTPAGEEDASLAIALSTARALMNAGALVTLTRQVDASLSDTERTALIRAVAPDLVVRVVCVPSEDGNRSLQTQYARANEEPVARTLQKAIITSAGAADGGITLSPEAATGLASAPTITCLLGLNLGGTQSPGQFLAEYSNKVAAGIAEGLLASLGGRPHKSAAADLQRISR